MLIRISFLMSKHWQAIFSFFTCLIVSSPVVAAAWEVKVNTYSIGTAGDATFNATVSGVSGGVMQPSTIYDPATTFILSEVGDILILDIDGFAQAPSSHLYLDSTLGLRYVSTTGIADLSNSPLEVNYSSHLEVTGPDGWGRATSTLAGLDYDPLLTYYTHFFSDGYVSTYFPENGLVSDNSVVWRPDFDPLNDPPEKDNLRAVLGAEALAFDSTAEFNLTISFEVMAPVPVPPVGWLFGSGLIGLIAIAKRKKS